MCQSLNKALEADTVVGKAALVPALMEHTDSWGRWSLDWGEGEG